MSLARDLSLLITFSSGLLSACALGCSGAGPQGARAPQTPRYSYQVVATYPHDTTLFTQGLAVSGAGELIESAGGYGQSALSVRAIDQLSPSRSVALSDEHFGEGVTQLGPLIMQLTWRSQVALLYRADDLSPLGELRYSSEGWGLAHGPQGTVYSDGSSELRWVSHPELSRALESGEPPSESIPLTGTLEVTRTMTVREQGRVVPQLNELEWLGRYLIANVWRSDELAVIDPELGEVVARVDLSGLLKDSERPEGFDPVNDVLNGVAWLPHDPSAYQLGDLQALTQTQGRLLVTGKRWPLIYELRLGLREVVDAR